MSKDILPEFPRIKHLPWNPNATKGDFIATDKEASVILFSDNVEITEKVDGANCGMALVDDHPIIRNRNHILKKGYDKATPAKKQFSSIFNWFYDHKANFEKLNELAGPVAVYGEWLLAQHGLEYDKLPSFFMAYDLYDYEKNHFIASQKARKFLINTGFFVVPQLHYGPLSDYNIIEELVEKPSVLTTKGLREGVCVKIDDGKAVTHRFKRVRTGFVQGSLWDKKKINKNKILK